MPSALPRCLNRRAVLLLADRHYAQRVVRQGPLQRQGLRHVRLQPTVDLGLRRENDWHGIGMDRRDDRVSLSGRKPNNS